jgi:hypothetical protein
MRTILPLLVLLLIAPVGRAQDDQSLKPTSTCTQDAPPPLACLPVQTDKATPLVTHGILLSPPKVYDDYYLRTLLANLQNSLASMKVLDQGTLLSHVGNVQGADLRQSSFAIQGSGPSTPGVSTFTPAPGVQPFSSTGSPTTTTPGTTTTTASNTPTVPTPTAPALTMPSNLAVGSLDTLNEEMQLASEITNLQLLLGGALSDRLQKGGGTKTTFTLGFPITIQPPSFEDKHHKNRIAEVEVSVCAPTDGKTDPPSIVTLLPRERTYDVAGLVDKSFLGSLSGVLGGVFSIGGSWFWSHQTFYLVQQQQTVAVQRASRSGSEFNGRCQGNSSATTFAWQFRPVLGQEYVRPGTTQTFVQLAIPGTSAVAPHTTKPVAVACVRVGWRATHDKLNRVSDTLDDERVACFDVPALSVAPTINAVSVTDIGGGLVSVMVAGDFLPGVAVRIGRTILSPTMGANDNSIIFTAAAQDLLAGGAFAVGSDGEEKPIIGFASNCSEPLAITDPVDITPFSDSQSLVKIRFQRPSSDFPPGLPITPDVAGQDPYVVILGDKIFGLRNSPFLSQTEPPISPPGANEILLLVPTDAVRAAPQIGLRRLLLDPSHFADYREIAPGTFGKPDFAVSKATLLSSGDALALSLVGNGLDHAKLVYPTQCSACKLTPYGPTLATILIQKDPTKPSDPDPAKDLKQIIVCKKAAVGPDCDGQIPPVVLDVPKADAAKPSLDKHDPVAPNTKQVALTGQSLDQVASLQHGKIPLSFRLSLDKKPTLIVDLPDAISGAEGVYSIEVTFADKTTATYLLTVQAKKAGT